MSEALLLTLDRAVTDPRLRGEDRHVLMHAVTVLDPWEWRPIKAEAAGLICRIKRQNASRALDRLAAFGYLLRGADDPLAPAVARDRRPYWYRLALTPRCAAHYKRLSAPP